MPFINYDTHNWCKPCENRFDKSKGINCPECGRRARTTPRTPAKSEDLRLRVPY